MGCIGPLSVFQNPLNPKVNTTRADHLSSLGKVRGGRKGELTSLNRVFSDPLVENNNYLLKQFSPFLLHNRRKAHLLTLSHSKTLKTNLKKKKSKHLQPKKLPETQPIREIFTWLKANPSRNVFELQVTPISCVFYQDEALLVPIGISLG